MTHRILIFFSLLGGWFAIGHAVYWFVTLEWSWIADWSSSSRAFMLGAGSYFSAAGALILGKFRKEPTTTLETKMTEAPEFASGKIRPERYRKG